MILNCSCPSPYQDAKYGVGRRVHAPVSGKGKNGGGSSEGRCTMCNALHSPSPKKAVVVATAKNEKKKK